jgi:hypothetical protein
MASTPAGDRQRRRSCWPGDRRQDEAAWATQARRAGVALMGGGGVFSRCTSTSSEASLEGELDGHLGYAKHDPAGRDRGKSRTCEHVGCRFGRTVLDAERGNPPTGVVQHAGRVAGGGPVDLDVEVSHREQGRRNSFGWQRRDSAVGAGCRVVTNGRSTALLPEPVDSL